MNEFEKEAVLMRYYKKTFRHGRCAAAYYFDFTSLIVLIWVLLWLVIRSRTANTAAALFLTSSCAAVAAFFIKLLGSYRFNSHIKRTRQKVKAQLIKQKTLIVQAELCEKIPHPEAYICKSAEAITADDVITAYRSGKSIIVGAAVQTEAAKELIIQMGITVKAPVEMPGYNEICNIVVSENEIDDAIIKKAERPNKAGIKALVNNIKDLSRERSFRYISTGILLILLSFAVKQSLYYRLIGSFCISVGSAVLAYEALKSSINRVH